VRSGRVIMDSYPQRKAQRLGVLGLKTQANGVWGKSDEGATFLAADNTELHAKAPGPRGPVFMPERR